MDNRLADVHCCAGVVYRDLVGADQLGRERVLDTSVGVEDVHARLPLADQLRAGP